MTIRKILVEVRKDSHTNDSLKFPPGFTPREDEGVDLQTANQRDSFVRKKEVEKIAVDDLNFSSKNNWSKNDGNELVVSGHFKKAESPRTGGSLLNLLDELIKVGQTMGYNMDGCMKNIEETIEVQGANGVFR
ncbi:hypothetical protein Tco_0341876 [Tanacetum coccineum]